MFTTTLGRNNNWSIRTRLPTYHQRLCGLQGATAFLRFHKVAKVGAKLRDADVLVQQSCQCRMHRTERRELLRGEDACVAEIPRLRGYGKLHRLLISVRSRSRPSGLNTVKTIKPTFDSTVDAGPSGSYVRCNRPWFATGWIRAPTTAPAQAVGHSRPTALASRAN